MVQAILSDTPNKCHNFDFTNGTFYKVDHEWLVLHFFSLHMIRQIQLNARLYIC